MTGTVMSDVPPVTTLMKAVKTKTAIRQVKLKEVFPYILRPYLGRFQPLASEQKTPEP
jgi:hypothetical protein